MHCTHSPLRIIIFNLMCYDKVPKMYITPKFVMLQILINKLGNMHIFMRIFPLISTQFRKSFQTLDHSRQQ